MRCLGSSPPLDPPESTPEKTYKLDLLCSIFIESGTDDICNPDWTLRLWATGSTSHQRSLHFLSSWANRELHWCVDSQQDCFNDFHIALFHEQNYTMKAKFSLATEKYRRFYSNLSSSLHFVWMTAGRNKYYIALACDVETNNLTLK